MKNSAYRLYRTLRCAHPFPPLPSRTGVPPVFACPACTVPQAHVAVRPGRHERFPVPPALPCTDFRTVWRTCTCGTACTRPQALVAQAMQSAAPPLGNQRDLPEMVHN